MKKANWYFWSPSSQDWLLCDVRSAVTISESQNYTVILADMRPPPFPPAVLANYNKKLNAAFGI